ncbi:hypothetical protein [Streptomyces sp. NBRC 110035]|uniref:hypothetical protein n=1 Tax=Streptomyces sp. NBRC 110035 TaxID=1547867 RepID=UPI0005A77F1D|nr:hypothetical protein [Streptomyces sp. NBRC 110035]
MTALLTCAVAFSTGRLPLLGARGPRPVDDPDVSPAGPGLTTTTGFGAAAVLPPPGGRPVDGSQAGLGAVGAGDRGRVTPSSEGVHPDFLLNAAFIAALIWGL